METALTEKVFTGDFLMKVGFNPNVTLKRTSVVLEINEVKGFN
jgi:alpha-galactosidase